MLDSWLYFTCDDDLQFDFQRKLTLGEANQIQPQWVSVLAPNGKRGELDRPTELTFPILFVDQKDGVYYTPY